MAQKVDVMRAQRTRQQEHKLLDNAYAVANIQRGG